MQQSVLITSVRGPDGIPKNHVAKLMLRWLRRSFLKSAFDGKAIDNPSTLGGGSFTGPSVSQDRGYWQNEMSCVLSDYLQHVDEIPHHFHLHLLHSAEILGYKHPDPSIRDWWNQAYHRMVNDMHLQPETEERMDYRLGDKESQWRAAEEVTAKGPPKEPHAFRDIPEKELNSLARGLAKEMGYDVPEKEQQS